MDKRCIKYAIFFISLLLLSFKINLDYPEIEKTVFDAETLKIANTGIDAEYLPQKEKEVLLYINLVRVAPTKFYTFLVHQYSGEDHSKYLQSLLSTLQKMKPVGLLMPSKKLSTLAYKHAKDMGNSGRLGHMGSNYNSFSKRAASLMKYFPKGLGECCQYGNDQPLEVVLDLLIDEGVPNLGHRRSLLSAEYNRAGVSIRPHARYEYNCVIDLGGD